MIVEDLMALEEKILSPLACTSKQSRGRKKPEAHDPIRTPFMRDRDRVIHSKAFRRLKHKTQVYVSPENDHYRTRLTHTLEVAQIARTIARALAVNEDLVEAIALAHDVGHTPFAHCGEETLNKLLDTGFKHSVNSVRVLSRIEAHGKERGLNLSWEVLDGVAHHSGFSSPNTHASTIEGQIVRYADKIAYVQHDIDDSIRAGLLCEEDLPKQAIEVLGSSLSARLTTLVTDLIAQGQQLKSAQDTLNFSQPVYDALSMLRAFLFEHIYHGEVCLLERERASYIVEYLFAYFIKHLEAMPQFYQEIAMQEGDVRGVTDYISGMTDNYCIYLFQSLTLPRSFIPRVEA